MHSTQAYVANGTVRNSRPTPFSCVVSNDSSAIRFDKNVITLRFLSSFLVCFIVCWLACLLDVYALNGTNNRDGVCKYCKVPCKRPPPPPPPPLKHKFLRKVGGGRLLGVLPFVQSIIQPLKVLVNTKRRI